VLQTISITTLPNIALIVGKALACVVHVEKETAFVSTFLQSKELQDKQRKMLTYLKILVKFDNLFSFISFSLISLVMIVIILHHCIYC
jgi:hypothetical protein